jgi:hypothetical protein
VSLETANTHTSTAVSDASLLQQLRLVTPHRARRHVSSLLRAPARHSSSSRAIMRLACHLFAPPPTSVAAAIHPPAMFRPSPASEATQQRSRGMSCIGWSHEMLCSQFAGSVVGGAVCVATVYLSVWMSSSATLTVGRPVGGGARTGWCRCFFVHQADRCPHQRGDDGSHEIGSTCSFG